MEKYSLLIKHWTILKKNIVAKCLNVPKVLKTENPDFYEPQISISTIEFTKSTMHCTVGGLIQPLSELMKNVNATPAMSAYLRNPPRPNAATRYFVTSEDERSYKLAQIGTYSKNTTNTEGSHFDFCLRDGGIGTSVQITDEASDQVKSVVRLNFSNIE